MRLRSQMAPSENRNSGEMKKEDVKYSAYLKVLMISDQSCTAYEAKR